MKKVRNGYGAYAPDLPGVGVASNTKEEVIKDIKKAIKMHLEDISESGKKLPKPQTEILKLEVA